jgi:deazaflavin-dependent oxidoreductase (nitroreductase family)
MTSVNSFNRDLIAEFRANGGQVTGPFAGATLLLLNTTGAKSGEPRTNPLVYSKVGDDYVIIASKGGAPTNPDWYYNLLAHPDAFIELPGETFQVRARVAVGDERRQLFDAQAAQMPGFKDYEAKTEREIPVVVLERI